MFALFAGLGLLVSIEIAVWLLACTIFISFENGIGATIACAIFGVALFFTADVNILAYAWANPSIIVYFAGLYLAVGLVWSVVKFVWKLRKARNLYVKDKKSWLAAEDHVPAHLVQSGQTEPKGRTEAAWITYCKKSSMLPTYAPKVSDNKSNILFWMWWWPFSVISTFFDDFFRKLVDLSWAAIKNLFESIRTAALGEAAKDLEEK